MHKRAKLLITTLIALIASSLTASSATANRSIHVEGGPRVQAAGSITFFGEGEGRSREITCDVTLLRTVTALIPKTAGTLFGKETGIAIDRGETARSPHCRHGSFLREVHDMTPLLGPGRPCPHRELGGGVLLYDCSTAEARLWKLVYDGFQGTLPRIAGVNFHVQNTQFELTLLEPFGGTVSCLYEGNAFGLIDITAGTVTRARVVAERTRLPRISGSGLCPARASYEGTFTIRPTLTITLL